MSRNYWILRTLVLGTVIYVQTSFANVEVIVATAGEKADIGIPGDTVGFMYEFALSPDGQWWAGHFELEEALDSLHMRGQGANGVEVIWTEEEPAPGFLQGELRAVAEDKQIAINDGGQAAGFARVSNAGIIQGHLVYRYDDTGLQVLAETGSAIPALPDAAFGLDFLSPNISNSGSVSFYADNITGSGISTANDALTLTNDGLSFGGQRKGVTTYAGNTLSRVDPGRYVVDQTGSRFLFAGDTTDATAMDDIVVVGDLGAAGSVVLQENTTVLTTAVGEEQFDVASEVVFGGTDIYVAGDTTGGTGIVLRNGEVLASEGDIAPNGFPYSGDPVALAADNAGNYAWVWDTANPDLERSLVLVLNGESILITEHDEFLYDYDVDGLPEAVRMDRLFDDFPAVALAGGYAYFMTELDDPSTTVFVGYGFLRVAADADSDGDGVGDAMDNCTSAPNPAQTDVDGDGFGNVCDADLNNDCVVNFLDLGILRSVFFTADLVADFNGDGVVNFVDLGAMRAAFFAAPGPSEVGVGCP